MSFFFFFLPPSCFLFPFFLLETQIWQTPPSLSINKLKTRYKYFTLILNAVSISFKLELQKGTTKYPHQIITISSKQHYKCCLKKTKTITWKQGHSRSWSALPKECVFFVNSWTQHLPQTFPKAFAF